MGDGPGRLYGGQPKGIPSTGLWWPQHGQCTERQFSMEHALLLLTSREGMADGSRNEVSFSGLLVRSALGLFICGGVCCRHDNHHLSCTDEMVVSSDGTDPYLHHQPIHLFIKGLDVVKLIPSLLYLQVVVVIPLPWFALARPRTLSSPHAHPRSPGGVADST